MNKKRDYVPACQASFLESQLAFKSALAEYDLQEALG